MGVKMLLPAEIATAAESGDPDAVRAWLDGKPDGCRACINEYDEYGCTLLIACSMSANQPDRRAALQKETSQRDALLGAVKVHDACDEQRGSVLVVVVYTCAAAIWLAIEPRSHGVQISALCRSHDFCWEDHTAASNLWVRLLSSCSTYATAQRESAVQPKA